MTVGTGNAEETTDRSTNLRPCGTGRPTHPRTLGLLVRGKNINPETLLATDYLNHFNEIIMLLEMVPSMPECFDDARAWAPKSYEAHFRDSAFTDKELAILAYYNAPERFRVPFDVTVARMDELVLKGRERIADAIAGGETEQVAQAVAEVSHKLQKLVDLASAIIHGKKRAMDQSEIDDILRS